MARTVTRERTATRDGTTVAEATLGPLGGALVGYATFAILVTIIGAVAAGMDRDFDITARDWQELGFGGGVATGVLLFVGFLYGGFVAGRMSRTAGIQQGIGTFVAALLLAALTALLVDAFADGDQAARLVDGLRALGVPGSGEEWRQIGTVAGIASIVGMLLGSVLGGAAGQRRDSRA